MPENGHNHLVSAGELAGLLGVDVDTVYRSWKTWGLTGYRIGQVLKFRSDEAHLGRCY